MTALQFETPRAIPPQIPANDAHAAAFPITLADEFRFLASQCQAQAEGDHRDQDRQFIAGLVAQLAVLGGPDAENTAGLLADEASRCTQGELADLIRLAGTALRHGARIIEGKMRRRGFTVGETA